MAIHARLGCLFQDYKGRPRARATYDSFKLAQIVFRGPWWACSTVGGVLYHVCLSRHVAVLEVTMYRVYYGGRGLLVGGLRRLIHTVP